MLACRHYHQEHRQLRERLDGQAINLRIILATKKGIQEVAKMLQVTKLATRKWLLNTVDSGTSQTGQEGE